MPWRPLVGLSAAAAVALVAALVLGEYELSGFLPIGAGAIVGFAVGESTGSIGRSTGWGPAAVAALLAAAALVQAGRIDAGEGLEPIKIGVWWGAALAAMVAGVRVLTRPPAP